MFLSAIAFALIAGALAGGGLPRLADLRLRWIWILGLALLLRFGAGIAQQIAPEARLPLGAAFIAAYGLIFIWLWGNWRVPGLQVAAVGIGLNTLAVTLNGGQMPIWSAAFTAAGFLPNALANDPFHFVLSAGSVADFVKSGGIFGDVLPIPIPVIRDVVSIGDVLLAVGIFWAIVYSMTRSEAPTRAAFTLGLRPSDPFANASAFPGGQAQAIGSTPALAVAIAGAGGGAAAIPGARAQSPYLALVRNRSFSLLWVGQLISFFGDRVHQVAIGVLVLQRATPLDVGIVFAATAVPNVFLGPLAGALVDRWDRRRTMIACDLVRAGLVLLVPVAINVHIGFVYGIALAVATVGLLFRPAKTAVVPLIVDEERLVTANSASSVNETLADLLGYPVAAAIVASLAKLIGAAFVLDSATYVVSALLIWGMAVPRQELNAERFSVRAIWREMAEGWRFLTHQAELLANTIVSTVAQLAFGAEIVCSLIYAKSVLSQTILPFPQNYGWLMASLGLGSVIGGVAIGWLAPNAPKGPMTIAGFIGLGASMVAVGLTKHPYVAIALFFAIGVANMLYLVPTITLFQEKTPQRLFGRVVSSRQALTFGAMAISMGAAGYLAGVLGAAEVLMLGGGLIAVAGLGGLLVPAMRGAR
jgi:DHA3 family macrolide efflux protein-like MFS transporter